MKRAIVYYHRADIDGVMSGALCALAMEQQGYRVMPIGVDYGDAYVQPNEDVDMVIVTDFAWSPQDMENLYNTMGQDNFIWLDHHQRAIDSLEHLPIRGLRTAVACATKLAWEWFYRESAEEPVPLMFTLVDIQDRHVSDHSWFDLATNCNFYWMQHLEDWPSILTLAQEGLTKTYAPNEHAHIGKCIRAYDSNKAKRHSPLWVELGGYVVPAYNYYNNVALSEHCASRFKMSPFFVMFTYTSDRVLVSLRSLHYNFDVSAIAAKLGGGGHCGAAGCRMGFNEWNASIMPMLPEERAAGHTLDLP